MALGTVELEPGVQDGVGAVPTVQFARTAFYIDLLAEQVGC